MAYISDEVESKEYTFVFLSYFYHFAGFPIVLIIFSVFLKGANYRHFWTHCFVFGR